MATSLPHLLRILKAAPTNPDELKVYAKQHGLSLRNGEIDLRKLPCFGPAPVGRFLIWSWDATHILLGTAVKDLEIRRRIG